MRQIHLKSPYSLGDIVVLTGAVRDLQLSYPGEFQVSVASAFPGVWKFNPHVTSCVAGAEEVDYAELPVDRLGATRRHYSEACLDFLNVRLGVKARPHRIGGDIHLSRRERNWNSDIYNLCGEEVPFWLVCSGGKFDIPIKWWDHRRYQEVIDALRGKVQFVQIGWWGNHHPTLEGAIDLRGKTTVRDLIHLVYKANGVLCGVTALMHLAAAVPLPEGGIRNAIIVGGAREPRSWEAYPGHEYIDTHDIVGCGNCWKGVPAGFPVASAANGVCEDVEDDLPRCMGLITAEQILARFEKLKRTGALGTLRPAQKKLAVHAVRRTSAESSFDAHNITPFNAVERAEDFIRSIEPSPKHRYRGRGIVICGGGVQYFTNAWVTINILRQLGCRLPIELWHLGKGEFDGKMKKLVQPLNVRCVNARRLMKRFPMRNPLGWELKSYALLHSRFEEVLLLDADNLPVRNPEYLFHAPQYQATGAIFWPDYSQLSPEREIWKLTGVAYREEPEFESGQMVINKSRCWRELNLAMWYNDHSEFFYRYIHGDKETFHLAWRKLGTPYSMPSTGIHSLAGTMCQHDFLGQRIFQHRNQKKWSFFGVNESVADFRYEADCFSYLEDLRARWNGKINKGRDE